MSPDAKGRLATVLYADLVGFSALAGWNEAEAKKRAAALREILGTEVGAGNGKLADASAEGAIAEFSSTGAAWSCAERVLQRVAARNAGLAAPERFEVTIGLALGEVVTEGDTLLGLGVLTAVAAHTQADPGGIALTDRVWTALRTQTSIRGVRLRPRKFSNLADPVTVFVVPPAKTGYWGWYIRRKKLVPVLGALVVALGGGGWFAAARMPGLLAAQLPKAPAAAPARREMLAMAFPSRDYLSSYDGGGTTVAFAIDTAPDGTNRLKVVATGERGWWGVVISRAFDFTGYDALVIPARSESGSGFRVMLKDDDESWMASVTPGPAEAPQTIPFSAFVNTPDPKQPGDGKLNVAKITQIQLMHLDPARSDTLWIGAIAASGPPSATAP